MSYEQLTIPPVGYERVIVRRSYILTSDRQQFDPDVQHLVSVILVHGSWRREDSNKIHIDVGLSSAFSKFS